MSEENPNFVYVLIAMFNGKRIPLACFNSRSRCEWALENELEDELQGFGISMGDGNYYTVEEWCLNSFLNGQNVKTMTSYDNRGNLNKKLVPDGREREHSSGDGDENAKLKKLFDDS